ncbi:MAG: transcription-repair coupling factor [Planctomycetaceae bacterium]
MPKPRRKDDSTTNRREITLRELPALLPKQVSFAAVIAALKQGQAGAIDGAWGSSAGLVVATLAQQIENARPLIVVLPRMHDVDEFADDVYNFLGDVPAIFPAWESWPPDGSAMDAVGGARLRVLRTLASDKPPRVIVTSGPALMQPVPGRDEIAASSRSLRVGSNVDVEELLRWLIERGFERVPAVELPGEVSVHGGIVDIFPSDSEDPLRLEFFGDELESLRRFDVESQRTNETLNEVSVTALGSSFNRKPEACATAPANDISVAAPASGLRLNDHLPAGSWVAIIELPELIDEARQYRERLSETTGLADINQVVAGLTDFANVTIAPIAADSFETSCYLQIESIERFSGPKHEVLNELATVVGRDEQVLIACHNEGERERLAELLSETRSADSRQPMAESRDTVFSDDGKTVSRLSADGDRLSAGQNLVLADRVALCVGRVNKGFRLVAERIIVLSDHELFGRTTIARETKRRRKVESRAIDSFIELSEGDFVVHLSHGIARYRGMKLMEKGDATEEHLTLEFANRVVIYVPVSLIHLVQKYVGGQRSSPELSTIGGTSWAKRKQKVADAVADLATDMILLQAARETKPGFAYPADSHMMKEFDAAFPYDETPDQLNAIEDCKADLERTRPMDRLICGDVGYGKTEVALRAAFKVIDAGKQVAVLVPTTVLAEQHFRTFSERMAEFPITVAGISRFKTRGEQKKIIEGAANGTIDLLVGTHRLVSPDVTFKDLGLLVIDEEQRFGVEHKEVLKHLRLEVDVLTLSATPIPRTLHMSLLGIRDISNLTTAPVDRMAVTTRVCRFDGDLIRQAIVRELNRNGQVFFVHNRVYNIKSMADRIQRIVPEARIGIGHGQMQGHELEEVMVKFVNHEIDIFVSTTIIESGIDIPNANTIFINDAQNYGLADLHQLRGRVGRYKHKAYCYLLLEEGKSLTPLATKRLKAIEEFSELGAGFKIAMRDLEIRGAGNILGSEQSGHMEAVGYELYCQLLENAVRSAKKQPVKEHIHVQVDLPVTAYLPHDYVPPGRPKIEAYRKLSTVGSFEELADWQNELRDRFGPLPPLAERMVELRELQLSAARWGIDRVTREDDWLVFGYRDASRLKPLVGLHKGRFRIVDAKSAYWPLAEGTDTSFDGLLPVLKAVLQPI